MANLHRRHLEVGQRSLIAARMAKLKKTDNLKRGDKKPEVQDCPSGDPSVDAAAALLNVSPRSVKSAKHVLEHGSKDLVAALESKQVTLNQAEKLCKAVRNPLVSRLSKTICCQHGYSNKRPAEPAG